MSRAASLVIADARLHIKDIGLAVDDTQALQLLSARYATWFEKFGQTVSRNNSLVLGHTFTVGVKTVLGNRTDIEAFLAIHREASSLDTIIGPEMEREDVPSNVIRLQNDLPTPGTPRVVSVQQEASSVTPGKWRLRVWPIPDATYEFSAAYRLRVAVLALTTDIMDVPLVDSHRLSRILAYDMGVVLNRPADRLQQVLADVPEEYRAAFGLSQEVLGARRTPEKEPV